MAINRTGHRISRDDALLFRCQGCGVRFTDCAAGPGTCPRCGAIGGHERRGRP